VEHLVSRHAFPRHLDLSARPQAAAPLARLSVHPAATRASQHLRSITKPIARITAIAPFLYQTPSPTRPSPAQPGDLGRLPRTIPIA
jgi:hypothetical protein